MKAFLAVAFASVAGVTCLIHEPAISAASNNGLECSTHDIDTQFDGKRVETSFGTFRLEILSSTRGKFHFVGVNPSADDFVPLETTGTTYLIGDAGTRPEERIVIDRESGKLHRFRDWSDLHHTDDTGYSKYNETVGQCHAIHIDANM
jgi:hypothetical protein